MSERWVNGVAVTDFGFTAQRNERGFGLMDYQARYYSPTLGRFISPDTIVPEPGSSGGFNRYRYTRNNSLRYTDPDGHEPCSSGNWGDCQKPKTSNNNQGEMDTQLDEMNKFTQLLELFGYEAGMLSSATSIGTIADGVSIYNNGDVEAGGLMMSSGLMEFGGIYIEYGESFNKYVFGQDVPPTSVDKTLGGAAIIGASILENQGRQLYLDHLAQQGANPVVIQKMRYESTMSTSVQMGEAHPLTIAPSLAVQIFGGDAIATQAEILTISDFQSTNPSVIEGAIRTEPVLKDTASYLKSICNSVGGNC